MEAELCLTFIKTLYIFTWPHLKVNFMVGQVNYKINFYASNHS